VSEHSSSFPRILDKLRSARWSSASFKISRIETQPRQCFFVVLSNGVIEDYESTDEWPRAAGRDAIIVLKPLSAPLKFKITN
jgi:hypothetical protein